MSGDEKVGSVCYPDDFWAFGVVGQDESGSYGILKVGREAGVVIVSDDFYGSFNGLLDCWSGIARGWVVVFKFSISGAPFS